MDSSIISGAVAAVAITGGFWAAGKFGPGLIVKKLHEGFVQIKDSEWVREPGKPKRARALLALTELLEDEIPEPGEGQQVYEELGDEIAAHVHLGSAAQWTKVARQFGDAVDLELDNDIKELGAPPPPPAAS